CLAVTRRSLNATRTRSCGEVWYSRGRGASVWNSQLMYCLPSRNARMPSSDVSDGTSVGHGALPPSEPPFPSSPDAPPPIPPVAPPIPAGPPLSLPPLPPGTPPVSPAAPPWPAVPPEPPGDSPPPEQPRIPTSREKCAVHTSFRGARIAVLG